MNEQFHQEILARIQRRSPFATASVVSIEGSASAKPGSQALFDENGANIMGWVGGGCAERFIGEQASQAILEKRPRLVTVDLDSEVFGTPCGGHMNVFIEPVLPPPRFSVALDDEAADDLRALTRLCGFELSEASDSSIPIPDAENTGAGVFTNTPATPRFESSALRMAYALKDLHGRTGLSLNQMAGTSQSRRTHFTSRLSLIGNSRITQTLSFLGVRAGWKVRVLGFSLEPKWYPREAELVTGLKSYEDFDFVENEAVVIAAHSHGDAIALRKAIRKNSPYMGLIASKKRSGLVIDQLKAEGVENFMNLRSPAGLDLGLTSPEGIALSVFCEMILEKNQI